MNLTECLDQRWGPFEFLRTQQYHLGTSCQGEPISSQDAIKRRFNGVLLTLLADQVLNHPVAEEKGENAGQEKDPPEGCFWDIT